MADTVEELAFDGLVAYLRAMDDGVVGWQPQASDYVVLHPMGERERRADALSVVAGPERLVKQAGYHEARLEVAVEFNALVDRDASDEPGRVALKVRGAIKKHLHADHKLATQNGGTPLVIDASVTAADTDPHDAGDFHVGGIVFIELFYRYLVGDPTQRAY